ncbi:hypothetical protein F511_43052 [Dorcoceras hygrometricum]|uniref:Uncharacterized protein n=1 Tax=Dorcoceras hygrometricum TaxID=472368 RepID=A0A2Z6ZYY4_9LAMI|nr:hypothetical protein F511_43052 [Dorcoceras hygrometricum]
MMTSTVMSSQSAVVKKRKRWISDDEVSSDGSNQQRATVQPAVADGFAKRNQTQATVHPDVSYSEPAVDMYPVAR